MITDSIGIVFLLKGKRLKYRKSKVNITARKRSEIHVEWKISRIFLRRLKRKQYPFRKTIYIFLLLYQILFFSFIELQLINSQHSLSIQCAYFIYKYIMKRFFPSSYSTHPFSAFFFFFPTLDFHEFDAFALDSKYK